ncbi:TAXI family TRAP transporter solute-binding subunit [Granulosicoccus sp.]|nr:TAXI family TRAP transporter solute-binding subunit [Granulosicoccus sp.]MDB4224256.1 TAXI family TRAP transporter solute-binding subunit [Granulosicoccus sp.]
MKRYIDVIGFTLYPLVLFCILCGAAGNVQADKKVFRIGTGGNAGTYLPIGTLIAQALNEYNIPRKTNNEQDLDVLLLAQRSNGSAANVREIGSGLLESGLTQADVAHWAYLGTGPLENSERISKLRAIGTLYFESLHLVASTESQIQSVGDLVGRSVSVDEVGSGTLLDVTPILTAYGLTNDDVKIVYLKPTDAIDRIRQGQLDAFFIIAGYPISGVSELVQEGKATIISIGDAAIEGLLEAFPFFTADTIPAQTYSNTSSVSTLAVPAQWVVNAELDDALIYNITKALWNERTLSILAQGHPKGREVRITSALDGIGIPLHPGSERYYRELGIGISVESP